MRARARWGITPLLAAPACGWALGLGDIELQSALNQPFRAEIALSATAEELEGLRIMLAAPEMFERYGLDRPAFLNDLEFRVAADRSGRAVVQITSRESIAEPFVTLLVEANWPRGRVLHEYTVLLDPPVLLPAPAAPPAIAPAETRSSSGNASGGAITRPAAPPATPRPAPAPTPAPSVREPAGISNASPPPAPSRPSAAASGTYGPVQRAETLWAIADRLRPAGITVNQMMIAIFEENPQAFGGNINILRAGATLTLPESADFAALATTVANAEVQRQTDEWQNRAAQGGQLRLLPPTEAEVASAPAPADAEPVTPPPRAAQTPPAAEAEAAAAAAAASAEESRRLLELRNAELQRLQEEAAASDAEPAPAPEAEAADPGVELESEQLFADETEPAAEPEQAVEPAPPAPAQAPAPVAAEPSLVAQAIGWLMSPLLWIGLGVAALLLTALWFVRRRKQDAEDVTGRWEALQQEIDEDPGTRDATERMRRQVAEETIVVEEQHAERLRPVAAETEPAPRRGAAARQQKAAPPGDDTLSSQTVINLDQADAVAEADFHIAYGLYDQAAELVQKALEAAPDRRDLKLKLLEVYFMWGNKEAFLKAAQGLSADLGPADADWNKVVIMGRQICPDEQLFSDAPAGAGRVDVDLEAGDSPLDLAFDDAAETADVGTAGAGLDLDLEASDERPAPRPAAKSVARAARDFGEDALDIGARTAAGLEAALFETEEEERDDAGRTTPDLPADSLAVTQESPTIERASHSDWATVESEGPTAEFAADAPTVETPTIESPAARSTSETGAAKTVAIPRRSESPTVEQPAIGGGAGASDYTAEIDLDDLGLDVNDIEGLPSDLGDLPMAPSGETDTREQPALRDDDALLSATGVTKVLHEDDIAAGHTAVLEDQDATQLAPGFDDATSTLTGTEVLEGRLEDDESGNTSLVRSLRGGKDSVDLDLADLTAALHGADTVEQPRASSFSRDVFGGGDTPLDLDIGADHAPADDDPTGTEEVALDPQTMTEVGTKLDLARAYIDMGDPEGARSILEEVLGEGDSTQRREAQGLIDALSA